jgi:RNA polymerase sigma factor (sigma-70 family)
MNESEEEFLTLMARVHLDDDQALAGLITIYEPAIRRAARMLLGKALRSSLDPTDLVQSVHLQLILGLRAKKFRFGSPEQLRSLAVTLLRHKLVEHWRRHRRQARHRTALAIAGGLTHEQSVAPLSEMDPARAAEYHDLVDHLFRHLRAEDRLAVVMRFQGYRTGEIAAELGIDPATLRMRLSRIRKRLHQVEPTTGRD